MVTPPGRSLPRSTDSSETFFTAGFALTVVTPLDKIGLAAGSLFSDLGATATGATAFFAGSSCALEGLFAATDAFVIAGVLAVTDISEGPTLSATGKAGATGCGCSITMLVRAEVGNPDVPDLVGGCGAGLAFEATVAGRGAEAAISGREALLATDLPTLLLLAETRGFEAKLTSIGLETSTGCDATLATGSALPATTEMDAFRFVVARFGGSFDAAVATACDDRARSSAATLPKDSWPLLGSSPAATLLASAEATCGSELSGT